MIVKRFVRDSGLYVDVRLGCGGLGGSDGRDTRNFYRKNLPYRTEHYPSLSSYWKIRLGYVRSAA